VISLNQKLQTAYDTAAALKQRKWGELSSAVRDAEVTGGMNRGRESLCPEGYYVVGIRTEPITNTLVQGVATLQAICRPLHTE